MENEIIKFLSQYVTLTEEQANAIISNSLFKSCKKGEVLLNQGEISTKCFFVMKGVVRSYFIIDGTENITEFYTEGQPITPVSYTTGEPSDYYLDCVVDTVVSLGSPEGTEELFRKMPQMKEVGLAINSQLLAAQQMSFHDYRNLPPEKRYAKLQETRPDLCNRVPQYMLASYLGIKPESLSRIRRRIQSNGR